MRTANSLIAGTACLLLSISASAQLAGSYTVPGSFSSLATAIASLNSGGVSGAVTINIQAGYTETVPAMGYSLFATGTSTSPITFQRTGTGANPILYAYAGGTAVPSSAWQDGIWRFIGSDYITIDGIDLNDPNTANPATMEFGYGLFKANITNGCRFNTIKNCVITLNRINCQLGIGSANEGSRGIEAVNATTGAHTTPLTITTAFGANSNNSFYGNLIQNCNIGISLTGFADTSPFAFADVNNDVGGLSAVTGNTVLNYGGGLDNTNPPASGIKTLAQYSLNISHNVINNNDGGGVDHFFRLFGIHTQAAQSANMTISNNTISVKSSTGSFTLTGIENNAGSTAAGNTISITGNRLVNCVYNATSTTNGTFFGIRSNIVTAANVIISNNTFTNSSSSQQAGNFTFIEHTGAAPNVVMNNNIGGAISLTAASGFGNFMFLNGGGGTSTGSLTIISNTIQSVTFGASSGRFFYYIRDFSTSRGFISNNVMDNLTLSTTASAYFVEHSGTNANILVSGNAILGSFSKTLGGGAVYGYLFNSGSSGTVAVTGNDFSNVTLAGPSSFYGVYNNNSTSTTFSVAGNNISNISSPAGTVMGVYVSSTSQSMYQDNLISNMTAGGPITGIQTYGSGSMTVSGNTISTYSCTGAATVYGLYQSGGSNITISRNKVYALTGNNSGIEIYGIAVASGTSNIFNNIVGDLTAPSAYNWNAISGIAVLGGQLANVSYNTVRLNAASTGFDFGTSAFYAVVSTTVNLRNNIFINLSTANGSAYTVAHRRSTTGLTTYGALSNNNLLYAGTPSGVNLLFSDATNSSSTLSSFKTFVSPRDAASVTENTNFLSTVGSSSLFLHITPTVVSVAESGATGVTGITNDYDLDIRQGNTGYAGNGFAPDIGADEYETVYPNCSTPNTATITPTAYTVCAGSVVSFTRNAESTSPGIQRFWQVGTSPGGPYTNVASAGALSFTTSPLTAGTYYFVLANTCTITSSTAVSNEATVTVSAYPVLTVTPLSSTLCTGASPLTISASGASAYTWTPSSGLNSQTLAAISASPASTTTYVVTGSNPGNCTGTASVVVNVVASTATITASPSSTQVCQGGNVNLSAVATTNQYTMQSISYSPVPTPTSGVGTLCSGGSVITSLSGGSLDDGNWYVLSIPFNFNFFGTLYSGFGISTNGFITLGSGVPNTYSGYSTSFPSTFAGRPAIGAVYSDLEFSGTGTINTFTTGSTPNRKLVVNYIGGRYYDGSSSGTGSVTTQIILYETTNIIEVHTARASGYNVAVEGIQNAAGNTAFVVSGRNAQTFNITSDAYRWGRAVTLSWSPGTYLSSTSSPTPVAQNIQNSITYTATAQTANGCAIAAMVSVSVTPSPSITITGPASPVCAGETVSLTASGANSISWGSMGTGTAITATPANTTTFTASGTWSVNSCPGIASLVVTVTPTPTIAITGNSAVCAGQTATLTANGATSYTWSTGPTSSVITVSPASTTVYTVTGATGNCTASVVQSLPLYPNPTVGIQTSNTVVCQGQAVNLLATGANSYTWTGGPANSIYSAFPVTSTTYTVTGMNTNGGCTATAVQAVSVNPVPNVAASGGTTICNGQQATLTASGANTYAWNTGSAGSVIVVSPNVATVYTVIGTDASNGCTAKAIVIVGVNQLPNVSIGGPATICMGTTVMLVANGASGYTWSTGSNLGGISVSPTVMTVYSTTGVATTGCKNTATHTIQVNAVPGVTIFPTASTTICQGESTELTAFVTDAVTYYWFDGSTSASVVVSPLSPTQYSVEVTNTTTGCKNAAWISIGVDPCVSLGEQAASSIGVYPNPFSGNFVINNTGNAKRYTISDVTGRVISEGSLGTGIHRVDLSEAAKGVYYLSVDSPGHRNFRLISR
jgi:hypothetical protein